MYTLKEALETKKQHCNTVFSKENNTVQCKKTRQDVARADHIADRIAARLNNPSRRPFYCKVAYSLPENIIEVALERSLKADSPERYFSWLTNQEMQGRSVVL